MRDFLEETISGAGNICLKGLEDNLNSQVDFKGPKDLVTVVDTQVEEYIVERIARYFPDHDIIGEETGEHLKGGRFCWIIDPIDGTTSFYHGQPYFSVSIALKKDDEFVLAGVYGPSLGQLFLAEKGRGATLNNRKIAVSSCERFEDAILATGFACLRAGHEHNNMQYFNRIVPRIRDIRRCGSAALDLAYVAAGRYDGFWELDLNIYDIGAGILLVTEAGGTVCDFHGLNNYPEAGIVATNSRITDELVRCLD